MRRDAALVSLSRDHHQALVAAARLRRATAATATDDRAQFLRFWQEHGHPHFLIEEAVLLPAFAAFGDPHHPLVLRALGDHVAIRRDADTLARTDAPSLATLHALGERLADHVRLEERELFPLIEATLPTTSLFALRAALDRAGTSDS